jgi:hypothetical protein
MRQEWCQSRGGHYQYCLSAPVNAGFHLNKAGPSPLLWIDVLTGM